ncbi:MAG TPA: T9SS type A sorting domain-containing protein, partial [Panacibacter sp.]|nr:T9SS type A sorting domain-containing protein [Panacibacter sp.]
IGNLTALQGLYLYYNQLSGSIPESIGNLTALKSLDLEGNQLSGIIPESIGNLTALQYLYLSFNQLNGTIPESTSNLTALKSLDLGSNRLSGSIPETIGNITVLQTLDLSFNQLSGSIPESIGNLSALQYLYLHSNQLSGSIPESIGNLTVLQSLYLNNNQLSSTVPESIGNLTALQILDLSLNQLSGTIPQSIGNLTALQYLSLSNNQLSGAIPSLLNLSISCYTNLSYNNFTFEGMEAVVKHFKKNYLTYVPQAIISLHEQGNLLSVSAGGSLSYNTYRWYRDGALVATNTGDSIYTVTIDGAYKVKVFNSICYALTLYSDSITTSVLPLTLLNFTAALQNNNALLNWSSTNELNTKEFIIQRSIDGVQFTNIGKLNARGNSSSVANYHYTDANITTLHSNKIYYRLQQQDINGSSSYSKTVVLNLSSQNSFVVYPNPAKNILHVQSNGKAVFVLHNNEGKILLKKTIDGNGEINIAALAAGLYYLRNTTTGEEKKIIKSL